MTMDFQLHYCALLPREASTSSAFLYLISAQSIQTVMQKFVFLPRYVLFSAGGTRVVN